MHANLYEKAFREVKDGQYLHLGIPFLVPRLGRIFLLRPVHEVGLESSRSRRHGKCNARRGLSVETLLVSNPPIKGLLHDMRLNPPKTRVAFLSDVAP